ncbi:E3 ubiquitin-protein ligase TRIM39-like [Cheilinus undulatus]|uniref:E3 ubiquitin-protein ligase TRIM39-like n=1 Tax=Cheilinus undulatus TaxID=241271 RepID=UPI001BD6573E|nr:E3 ubiquitin-protein ligase TRIM39-like [Cheilinus undulatus]XP_041635344.1 E3 ubiquitin-protein ligase TRIM39-like [Cheilinus undulatus]XP_041635345.1 E3 ubiquitin-protein ligase TRIM39-like [Cheilinus undulatus]
MTSAQASPCDPDLLEKHVTCTICKGLFKDPVTTACGHSFCKRCLFWSKEMVCPLCNKPRSQTLEVNDALSNVVKQIKNKTPEKNADEYTGAPGEVACDMCTKQKLKAKKSCLVCLASYCSTHLKNHFSNKRLKGHKLVQPVENLDERACLQHGRPLELYSRKRERCICVLCMEEDQEEVVPNEEEWNEKKVELENTKTELRQKIENRRSLVDEINASLKSCEDQLNTECENIDAVFTAVIAIVKEAHAAALRPLKDRRQVVKKEAKEIEGKLKTEISKLEKTMSELDNMSAHEDHILFLQKYPSLQDLSNITDCPEVELDTSLSFGTMRKITTAMMESIQQELEKLTPLELQRIPKFTVDVRLDPTTAHQHLALSEDGKEVKDGEEDQRVPFSPERFDTFGSVLGLNSLKSGRSYWEVEVRNKSGWDLGVARGDANRKGKLSLTPDNGYWVTVHYEDDKYAALTAPPVVLSLREKPEKVGVFVDLDEGLVSFYDVTAESHIYSFTECSFNGKIFPYFSPHLKQDEKNMDPLIISCVKECRQGTDLS